MDDTRIKRVIAGHSKGYGKFLDSDFKDVDIYIVDLTGLKGDVQNYMIITNKHIKHSFNDNFKPVLDKLKFANKSIDTNKNSSDNSSELDINKASRSNSSDSLDSYSDYISLDYHPLVNAKGEFVKDNDTDILYKTASSSSLNNEDSSSNSSI